MANIYYNWHKARQERNNTMYDTSWQILEVLKQMFQAASARGAFYVLMENMENMKQNEMLMALQVVHEKHAP